MNIHLLSDLHLETEAFTPTPAPGAEVLVLAGDIDATWHGFARFANWPVPVLMVAGNHEFDGRNLVTAWPALRDACAAQGITLLERQSQVLTGADGRRVRFCATIRWADFDLFGVAERERAMRAASWFQRVMKATRGIESFEAPQVREEALACRAWLAAELAEPAEGRWDATVAITHFAPSLRSADPRFGVQPTTASFCNADDDLIGLADLWLHGHVHVRQDWREGKARVVANPRGLVKKGEPTGFDAHRLVAV